MDACGSLIAEGSENLGALGFKKGRRRPRGFFTKVVFGTPVCRFYRSFGLIFVLTCPHLLRILIPASNGFWLISDKLLVIPVKTGIEKICMFLSSGCLRRTR